MKNITVTTLDKHIENENKAINQFDAELKEINEGQKQLVEDRQKHRDIIANSEAELELIEEKNLEFVRRAEDIITGREKSKNRLQAFVELKEEANRN